jgi:putative transposase
MQDFFSNPRNSRMEIGEVYFWTATIYEWKKLLKPDAYKEIIINSLNHLYQNNLIKVYGLTIMPNHMHMIWELLKKNGKELPKYTSHEILVDLKKKHQNVLEHFYVNEKDRSYRIWQRDPLAVKILSREMVEQKLDYLHNNPLQPHWNLVSSPEDYYYSSAGFYLNGNNNFPFLSHYWDRF